jgi:hypothetical protein
MDRDEDGKKWPDEVCGWVRHDHGYIRPMKKDEPKNAGEDKRDEREDGHTQERDA